MKESGELKWFTNRPAVYVLVLAPVAIVGGYAIGLVFFPILLSFPLCWNAVALLVTVLFSMTFLRPHAYYRVGIGHDIVVLKGMLKTVRIERGCVESVTLSQPIESDDPNRVDWWGKPMSNIRIHFVNGKILTNGLMAEGLQLRMARALDPENYLSSE